jgi:hypothetical protein
MADALLVVIHMVNLVITLRFKLKKTGRTKFAFSRKKVLFDCSVFFMHNQMVSLHSVCPVVSL